MLIAHFSDSGGSRDPPWKEHGARDRDPLEGTWDQAAKQEVISYRESPSPPPVDRMASFASGKYACGPSLLRDNKTNQFYASRSNMINQCVSSAVDSCFQVSSKVVKPF